MLLWKLLRGDESDNIPGLKRRFPPRKMRALIQEMSDKGLDVGNIFRYGGEEQLFLILDALNGLVETSDLEHVADTYKGMTLNQPFVNVPKELARRSAKVAAPVRYNDVALVSAASAVGIRLNIK